jgi:DNA-binding NtrC family response regulator
MKRDVLVVDRDRDLRFEVHRLLSRSCDVTSVADGMSALYLLRRNPLPELIIIDPDLEDFPDWSFLRHLKNSILYSSIPVIVISAHSGRELREQAVDQGVMEYFPKPMDPDSLERVVEGLFEMESGQRW